MAASPAMPGLFLCFAACVLLIIVSVSAPKWDKISFLDTSFGTDATTENIHFGVFGYTGSGTSIGYYFPISDSKLNSGILHSLTKALILYPICAGLAGLGVLFGICGASYHRAGTVILALLASLATILTFVAWVLSMVLFGIAREQFRDQHYSANFGNANWIALGAWVALVLSSCLGTCGIFGSYRRRREAAF
ncbi:pali-domain-containing protein [Fistulina hepatica ATCC 64428]|uniref:Pali-domain-containing protein n=1 Tax=Fistulina hepatica ATCC 64428 TaxID=1128425 RepID=A0A0D7AQM2_9AGAR|nr:pali-domain-containing protein [Fistulina hepatica ATCC 64428]